MSNYKEILEEFDALCLIMGEYKEKSTFSTIEKDIILENLRKAYYLINKELPLEEMDEKQEDLPLKEEPVVDNKVNVQEKVVQEEEIPPVPPLVESINIEEDVDVNMEGNEVVDIDVKPNPEKDKSILGDKFQGSKKFMDELISEQHPSKDISLKLQSRPIDDIGKAIGLNDKFLFINELFNGDSLMFKKTLEQINQLGDFNEAFSFLTTQFSWDMKKETANKFMELVKRKFITPLK